jgi:uncharacterized membrane protein
MTTLRRREFRFGLKGALSALALSMSTFAHADIAYRITALESPDPGAFLATYDLNNKGEIVGSVEWAGIRASRWNGGNYVDLGAAIDPAAPITEAVSINDHSVIVANSYNSGGASGYVLSNGQRTAIQPGAYVVVNDINNRNQVIGHLDQQAFLWKKGQITMLDTLPDSTQPARPVFINDRGTILGVGYPNGVETPVLWKNGTVMSLGMPDGARAFQLHGFNFWEQAAVSATVGDQSFAYVWHAGQYTQLPLLDPNAVGASANGINNWGAVVGTTFPGTLQGIATLWVGGEAFDLNNLIANDDPLNGQIHLDQAYHVNDAGQIVAIGQAPNAPVFTTYLLTPVWQ